MKKKELLSMPALEATEEMLQTAADDKGRMKKLFSWTAKVLVYKHDLYFRTVERDGILKVAVFTRADLKERKRRPRCEVYISREEEKHLTYLPQTEKWSEGKLYHQMLGTSRYWVKQWVDWEEAGAREMVQNFLQVEGTGIYAMIGKWQETLAERKLRRKHSKEAEEIDAVMAKVPDLPSDWDNWIYRSAYSESMYLFFSNAEKKAYCTRCGQEMELKKKLKHNQQMRCPNCRAKVTALSWNKQKSIKDYKYVGILQELTDRTAYILRIFRSDIKRYPEDDWRVSERESGYAEERRFLLAHDFTRRQEYEYGPWKGQWKNGLRWCYAVQKGYYDGPSDECILYYRNLKKLRKGTLLNYMPIEKILSNNQGCYCHAADQLLALSRKRQIEYLIKAKLYRLSWDLTKRGMPGDSLIDWTKPKLWEALKIDKDQLKMCIKMNISEKQLMTLHAANGQGVRLTMKQLIWYDWEAGAHTTRVLLRYGHAEKVMRYLQKMKREEASMITDYVDYLLDIEYLQIEPTEDVIFPRSLRNAHLRTTEQRQEIEDTLKKADTEKKDHILQKMLPRLDSIYTSVDLGEYQMVLPTCKEDFNREGRDNHNCVGGSYFDKMLKGKCVVLFLRRKEEPEKAFCTVEMQGSRVVQCRAIRNSEPPEEVTELMDNYSRMVDRRMAMLKRTEERMLAAAT